MRFIGMCRAALVAGMMMVVGCINQTSRPSQVATPESSDSRLVSVSYYGGSDGFHGAKTASGEKFNCHALTAAHKTLAFGTMVTLTNPNNGRRVTVRINDRGPYVRGRELDISLAAAKELGIAGAGVAKVLMSIEH